MAFGFSDFLWRWGTALLLVVLTFNPTGWSYVHWVTGDAGSMLPLKVLTGLLLLAAYVILVRASIRSLGAFGMALTAAVLLALVWLFVDLGILTIDRGSVLTWVALLVTATILAVGLSWSYVRRKLSGQVDMDDVDE